MSSCKKIKICIFLCFISTIFVYAEEEKFSTEEPKLSIDILDSSYELKFMEFENEILAPQKTADGWEVIHSQNGNVERFKYDNDYRLIEKETWKINSSTDSSIVKKESYIYFEKTNKVESKTLESSDNKKNIFYNDAGLVVKTQDFFIKEQNQYLINETFKDYDEKNRLVIEISNQYKYKQDYKRIDYKFETKYIYTYNENEDIPPDFEYYENNVLKTKNIYTQRKGTYTSQIFFEGGLSVKTIYEEYSRKREIYFQNDTVTRVKDYD